VMAASRSLGPGTVEVPRELLEKLAPSDGILDSEIGYCCLCYKGIEWDRLKGHHPDCPWLAARKLLGDELE
jgi:hypothetical protein